MFMIRKFSFLGSSKTELAVDAVFLEDWFLREVLLLLREDLGLLALVGEKGSFDVTESTKEW